MENFIKSEDYQLKLEQIREIVGDLKGNEIAESNVKYTICQNQD